MSEPLVGTVTHYFRNIDVAAVELAGSLHVGDTIRVIGHTSNFTQTVESMQIEHEPVEAAGEGDVVGIKVIDRARPGDDIYRAIAD